MSEPPTRGSQERVLAAGRIVHRPSAAEREAEEVEDPDEDGFDVALHRMHASKRDQLANCGVFCRLVAEGCRLSNPDKAI